MIILNNLNDDLKSDKAETLDSIVLLKIYRLLWKQLLLHDEIINASKLIESAPWQIRDHDDIQYMKSVNNILMTNLNDPQTYFAHYLNYKIEQEGYPLPLSFNNLQSQYNRFIYTYKSIEYLQTIIDKKIDYLDVGSFDGWLTNRLGLSFSNINIYGIELSENGANIANQKSIEFQTHAQHARCSTNANTFPSNFPKKFDIVSVLEIYEHVPDTIEFLKQIKKLLNLGGYLILSCPRGSWCQGHDIDYHIKWSETKFRDHVRAPIKLDLEEDLKKTGFEIINYQEFEINQNAMPDHEKINGQTSICLTAISI